MSGHILYSGLDLTKELYQEPTPPSGPAPSTASGQYSGAAISWDCRSVLPSDTFDNGNPIYVHFTGSPVRRSHLSRCNDGQDFGTKSTEIVGAQEGSRRRRLPLKSLQRKCEVSEDMIASWIYLIAGGFVSCLVCWVLRGNVPLGDKGFSQVVIPLVPVECTYTAKDSLRLTNLKDFFYESQFLRK